MFSQGLVSLANFVAGWWLLRTAGPAGYAHWVLAISGIALLVSLQVSFLGPPLSLRMARLPAEGQRRLVGGLLGEQQRGLRVLALTGLAGMAGLALFLPSATRQTWYVGLAALCALLLQLRREFQRQVLYSANRAPAVMGADFVYGLVLTAGVIASHYTSAAWRVVVSLAALGAAAAVARSLLARHVARHLAAVPHVQPGMLREIAPLALWSTSGSALAWAAGQGFLTLVAIRLGPESVATLAATRLPMMPMNLLVAGMGGLLAPASARWLVALGPSRLQGRLVFIGLALAAATAAWTAMLWPWHVQLFSLLSPAPLAHAPLLFLGWGLAYTLLALRDTLAYLPAASGAYRSLTLLTGSSALISTTACLTGMLLVPDARGAMMGIVIGEAGALLGVLWLVRRADKNATSFTPAGIAYRA